MPSRPAPYLATVALVALLTGVKLVLPTIGARTPFLLYLFAVVVAAWYGDRRAGALAIALGAAAANYLFLGTAGQISVTPAYLLQTGVFALEGAALVAVVSLIRRERARTAVASARVTGLQALTNGLAGARTPEEVGSVVVSQGVEALDARSGAMTRIDIEGAAVLFGSDEARDDEQLERALAAAAVSGEKVISKRCIALSLRVEERRLGAVGFAFRGDRELDATENGLLDTMAAQASQALDRAESFTREVWLRRRLEILAGVSADLAATTTREEVAKVVVARGTVAMSADTCTLYVLSDDGSSLDLIGSSGVAAKVLASIESIEADAGNPTWAAFESRQAMWVETAAEYADKIPRVSSIEAEGPRVQAFWSVPLIVEGRAVGLLGMGYHKARTFTAQKRSFVETFTQHCAQALLRAQRLDAERYARLVAEEARASIEREEQRRALVAEATAALAATLDYKVTLTRLTTLLVPKLADWCAIEMIDEDGKSDQLAVAHSDPKMVEYAWELRRRYPPPPNATTGVPNVLRTGVSELYPEITDEMIVAGAIDEEHLRISRELSLRSAMVVPLVARGTTLGAITMVHAESGRRYTGADLALAEEIARRAAISVDNARLYGAEQRARAAADEANRLKDEFLATVSHELRTPLNAILGWSRMVNSGAVEEPAKKARATEIIERNAVAMTQLIEDLLDVSRIISGKMRLEIESVDLGKVVEAAIESIRPAALAKEISLRPIIEPAPGPLLGDPNRLQQVVWNLLSNAVKFTPRRGRVEIVVRRNGSSVEVSVRDDGAGIDPAFAPYVFDRFRQADGTITRSHGGLGLGLAITRQLVEMHGGSVVAASEGLGRGATFTVTLPITAMHPLADGKTAVAARGTSSDAGELDGLRVLAVDDDEDSRRLVHAVLEKAGARVTVASSVEAAMEAFDREPPDVVVSDIGMPGQDGLELIRRIRARPADRGGKVPAAALTAYARAGDRTRVLSAGFSMHLPKPIEPEELIAVVVSLARFSR